MICYRCNHEAGLENICPICGTDIHIFQKANRLSNMYYNDGLEKAGVRNLSGAIVSLKKSLKFNKYNTDARNLLGLIYYEMGEVVDALSEWVISINFQPESNVAERYLEVTRKNRSQLDTINQTIKKYNQALLYCKQDSKDMAIIQLKKVLSLNPKLIKAHQLLALLYMQDDRLEQAKKSLRNAGRIDANNTTTLRYLKEVNTRLKEKGGTKKKPDDDLISYQSGNETIIMPKRFQEFSLGSTLGYLLIGLVIGALVIGFLVVPGVKSDAKQETKKQLLAANDTITQKEKTISDLEAEIADLETQMAQLQGQADAVPAQAAAYEALISAYVSYTANDFIAAGNIMESIDSSLLSETALGIYNNIQATISEKYYQELYNVGYSCYTAANYQEAINNLLRVVTYNQGYMDGNAAYYLAQSYRKNGDVESAKPYYQYIVDNYPNTERAATSKNYVGAQ